LDSLILAGSFFDELWCHLSSSGKFYEGFPKQFLRGTIHPENFKLKGKDGK